MKKVYVAGPYTKGDVAMNVRAAIIAGDDLAQAGFTPFIPHVTHLWYLLCPHDWEFWMAYDLQWLGVCDCLLRLPGDSVGADLEMKHAQELDIPVYFTIEDVIGADRNQEREL